jgi:hypothetical protein
MVIMTLVFFFYIIILCGIVEREMQNVTSVMRYVIWSRILWRNVSLKATFRRRICYLYENSKKPVLM